MKCVVVTAGASGIGRAIAESFLNDGAQVAICDIDSAAVDAFHAAFPKAIAAVADVTDEAQMNAFLNQVETDFGGADVVCSNAGTGGPAGLVEDLDYTEWKNCVAANVHGNFLTCRWAARVMRAAGSGSIILTSSTAGLFGYPYRSPYATAKWGLIGLMKTLAMELGPVGVRVNAICPGAVEGDRMDRVVANEATARGVSEDGIRALYVKGVSLRSWVRTDDLVAMVRFLTSDAGAKISGQALAIDGHTETLTP